MGVRKRKSAEELKEARKHIAFAKLNNCPTSPRKMRLMADLIRGEGVDKAYRFSDSAQKNHQFDWKSCCYQQ